MQTLWIETEELDGEKIAGGTKQHQLGEVVPDNLDAEYGLTDKKVQLLDPVRKQIDDWLNLRRKLAVHSAGSVFLGRPLPYTKRIQDFANGAGQPLQFFGTVPNGHLLLCHGSPEQRIGTIATSFLASAGKTASG
jgi:hypothetical protein